MPSPLPVSSCSRQTLVALSTLVLLAGCGDGLVLPDEGEPAAIAVLEGDDQRGRVGEPLNDPLVVQVTDSRGRPVRGTTVAFEFVSAGAGAAVVPEEKTTDGDGLAEARLVLGTSRGRQDGRARVVLAGSGSPIQASFSAMALPENANSMAAVAGQDQTGHVGSPLDDRLVVEVTDGFGNPVAGVPINWAAVGGGSVSELVVETDEDGRARVERILGPAVGEQSTVASSEGLAGSPVTFTHTALAGDASRLVIVSGSDQTGEAGSTLPEDLVVRLIDADGNGVPGTAVSWVVATGGGSGSPEISTTDGDGRTSTRWTLGGAVGQQRLDAVVSGVGVTSFRATATSGAPASLFIRTEPSASARNGVAFTRQPVIQLRDARGNDVGQAGVRVTVVIGSGGGELGGTRQVSTDGSGRATFTDLSIAGSPGPRTLVFTASGYAQVTSSEIDVVAIGTSTTITSDSPDPSVSGTTLTVAFSVTSAGSTPTGSVTVTVGDGSPSCTGSLSGGSGSCQLTLNTVGNRTLTATYSGGPGFAGSSDTEPHTVTAQPPSNREPDADYNWDCNGPTCQFTDASEDPDGTVVSWRWDFGGTGTSDQPNPVHTFPGAGRYDVSLTVTDNAGATNVSVAAVEVEAANQAPAAEFTWQCTELDCAFQDQSTDSDGRVEGHAWTFGDGGTSSDDNPDHAYAAGGTYPVTLTVTDNDGATNSVTHEIIVAAANQSPTAAFTESCAGLTCSFSSAGSGDPDGTIVAYSWTFGDGATSAEPNPSHSYPGTGSYTVTLEVRDNDNANGSTSHAVSVTAPNVAPTAAFSAPSCTAGQACPFSSTSTDSDGTIASYTWDFGDGSGGDGPILQKTYSAANNYPVTLTVTDNDGASSSITQTVTVGPAPEGGVLGLLAQPPGRTESGRRLRPEPHVELRDAAGAPVLLSGITVSATIASGSGTLGGTTSRPTDGSGRARFDELRVSGRDGASVTLAFTAPGFAQVDTSPILIEED